MIGRSGWFITASASTASASARIVRGDEVIGIKARFKKTAEPVTVKFIWKRGDAVHFTSEPFTIDGGNTEVWSYLDDDRQREPGAYTVTLVGNGIEAWTARFDVL